MAAGMPATMNDLNRAAGLAVTALAQALDNVVAFSAMLGNAQRFGGVAGLVAAQGYAQADAQLIVDSFSALSLLAQVAYGQIAQSGAEPSNFFFEAQQLMGATPL